MELRRKLSEDYCNFDGTPLRISEEAVVADCSGEYEYHEEVEYASSHDSSGQKIPGSSNDNWDRFFEKDRMRGMWGRKTGCILNNSIQIGQRVDKGSQGDVYAARFLKTGRALALKFQPIQADYKKPRLEKEFFIHNLLSGTEGIPEVYSLEVVLTTKVMAMDLLGPSLADLKKDMPDGRFSLKTVLMIADQTLTLLEKLHSHGFVHRDVKPENFLIGRSPAPVRDAFPDSRTSQIYMIDFGCAKKIITKGKNGQDAHIPMESGKYFVGTLEFGSVNAHRELELSRRDDLESLFYSLMSFTGRGLPWRVIIDQRRMNPTMKRRKVMNSKRAYRHDGLKHVPVEFRKFYDYVTTMDFTDTPDYEYLRGLFSGLMEKHRLAYDYHFDWDERTKHRVGIIQDFANIYGEGIVHPNITPPPPPPPPTPPCESAFNFTSWNPKPPLNRPRSRKYAQ